MTANGRIAAVIYRLVQFSSTATNLCEFTFLLVFKINHGLFVRHMSFRNCCWMLESKDKIINGNITLTYFLGRIAHRVVCVYLSIGVSVCKSVGHSSNKKKRRCRRAKQRLAKKGKWAILH